MMVLEYHWGPRLVALRKIGIQDIIIIITMINKQPLRMKFQTCTCIARIAYTLICGKGVKAFQHTCIARIAYTLICGKGVKAFQYSICKIIATRGADEHVYIFRERNFCLIVQ